MKLVVTSPSFSKNEVLEKEISKYFKDVKLNLDGKRFDKQELVEYIGDAELVIAGLEPFDKEVVENLSHVKMISKYGVGLNNIDLQSCKAKNIAIGWTGGVNKLSVAEMTLGYMLMLCRNLFVTSNKLKNGIWDKSGGFQLSGKKIGIVGVGYIGKELVRLLKPFGCEIYVNDIIDQDKYYRENGLIEASKEEIYKTCDVVTIHTPFDDSTKDMINIEIFKMMKRSSFIINSARGGIINEYDLKFALQNKLIAGAAIDAYIEEPPTDSELIKLESLICTPHIGGNAKEAIEAMGLSAIENLKEFCKI